jgi:hypothetical protein
MELQKANPWVGFDQVQNLFRAWINKKPYRRYSRGPFKCQSLQLVFRYVAGRFGVEIKAHSIDARPETSFDVFHTPHPADLNPRGAMQACQAA